MPGTRLKLAVSTGAGLMLFLIGGTAGCRRQIATVSPPRPIPRAVSRQPQYTIQVGAFSQVENAVRQMETMNRRGLDAYYFVHPDGLFKVRLGSFLSRQDADRIGSILHEQGLIDEFFAVEPESLIAPAQMQQAGFDIRGELVRTAERFLGYPYAWGRASPDEGFDCSGLAMVVYRLNGVNLPRTSRQQFSVGKSVAKSRLKPGDLVFFATKKENPRRVSHVGIYAGRGRFIHAPGKNMVIRFDSLEDDFYRKNFAGARSML